jgi:hypothetical protein
VEEFQAWSRKNIVERAAPTAKSHAVPQHAKARYRAMTRQYGKKMSVNGDMKPQAPEK